MSVADSTQTVCVPDILLPQHCDMHKWAVVACDQFTSDRAYWQKLDALVGDAPGALRLILPECYLADADVSMRVQSIQSAMRAYVNGGLFASVRSYILVKRTFASGKARTGIVAAVDLEAYDFRPEKKARIRATEGTVESRLPPRVSIRAHSLLELPHILLLADDPQNTVFAAAERAAGDTLYDFALNGGGGHICGRAVTDAAAVDRAFAALGEDMRARYGQDILLLAGDGNHSLAAAKLCYEQAKQAGDPTASLKRYALCEIVNLYDSGIDFQPIHRAVFGVDPKISAAALAAASQGYARKTTVRGGGQTYTVGLPDDPIAAVAFVQDFLDTHPSAKGGTVDYIHGDDVLRRLGDRADCLTIALPPMQKEGFTDYIVRNGILPRKTFSMGSAQEKRYYLEARRIG